MLNLMLVKLLDLMLISPIERRVNQTPMLDKFDNKFSSFHYHEGLALISIESSQQYMVKNKFFKLRNFL
jgi:hypothetical protein